MKKYLSYIIAALVIVGALVAAWIIGTPSSNEKSPDEETTITSEETGKLYEEETPAEETTQPSDTEPEDNKPAQEKASEAIHEEKAESVQSETPEPVDAVSLTVDCSDILENMDLLAKEKRGLVPDSGVMYSSSEIEITEGESVFDVLKRTLISSGVHLEFNLAPVTNSAYIEGIGNIYEFDCGERSGWKYSVNGEYPRVGCSDFKVKSGDKIVFVYKIKAY